MSPPGLVVTPRHLPAAGSTTPLPSIWPASRSWPAGPISGSPSWTGQTIPGPRRWTRRIGPAADKVIATATQVREFLTRLHDPQRLVHTMPLFVFDAGYDLIALTHELAGQAATLVVRIRDDRVFYARAAPAEPGTVGRPRRHGNRFSCADPSTWPSPTTSRSPTMIATEPCRSMPGITYTPDSGAVAAGAASLNHPSCPAPWSASTCNTYPNPPAGPRRPSLLVAAGTDDETDIEVCWRAYLRRFDIEHTFRFVKNTWAEHPG
ncbi:MAG: transposase [Tessaracoccus sp.]